MRQGFDAHLVFDEQDRLVAFATGSDACSEHECGSKSLQSALCKQPTSDAAIIAALKRNEPVRYPSLLETKCITKFPPQLQFDVSRGSVPEAVLGFADNPLSDYYNELRFPSGSFSGIDINVAGAWDDCSFAIRVRTERYVNALTEFHDALRAGKVLFAGLFLKNRARHLAGVILANSEYLTGEDLAEVERAQQKYESKLRLKARDESGYLMQQLGQHMNTLLVGFLWPVWADDEESEVLYAFNPGSGVKAAYYGPYRKEDILAWAEAKGSYDLPRARRAK